MSKETDDLATSLDLVSRHVAGMVRDLRAEPAEAERMRLAELLGQVANEMFNGHEPVYPSNLLDVISAWLNGWALGGGHAKIEKPFLAAVERAEAKLRTRARCIAGCGASKDELIVRGHRPGCRLAPAITSQLTERNANDDQ